MCCAVALRRQGHQVTLIDRNLPGSQCSFGNAGTLGGNAHFPMASMLPKIPGMLLNPKEPLSILWKDFPGMLPWFTRYLLQSRPARTLAIAQAAASLNGHVHTAMDGLLKTAGASDLLRWGGRLFAYRSEANLRADAPVLKLKNQAGIEMQEISGDAAREMEPSLGPLVARAIYTPDAGHVINPYRLVQQLCDYFVSCGGELLRADVRGFSRQGSEIQGVSTDFGEVSAQEFVIAAGVWSTDLATTLGVKLPLVAERGYHAMLREPGISMSIPTMWMDRRIILSPMEHGIRIAGMAEFGSADSPPNFGKIGQMLVSAKELMPSLDTTHYEPWMGPRPSTPDYLPVIGRSSKHANLVFACGHGHSGLMFGPVTANLVCEVIAGQSTSIDLQAFSPNRFT